MKTSLWAKQMRQTTALVSMKRLDSKGMAAVLNRLVEDGHITIHHRPSNLLYCSHSGGSRRLSVKPCYTTTANEEYALKNNKPLPLPGVMVELG